MTVYISNQSQSDTSCKQHCQIFKMKHDITLLQTLTFSLVEKALNCICLIPGRNRRKPMTSLSNYVYLSQVSCFSLTSEWNIPPSQKSQVTIYSVSTAVTFNVCFWSVYCTCIFACYQWTIINSSDVKIGVFPLNLGSSLSGQNEFCQRGYGVSNNGFIQVMENLESHLIL